MATASACFFLRLQATERILATKPQSLYPSSHSARMSNFGTVFSGHSGGFCLRHGILTYLQAFSWRQVYRAECPGVTTFLVAVIAARIESQLGNYSNV